jgi:NTE family protein
MAEADLHPDWVAGISIGAVNSALIAGPAGKARRAAEGILGDVSTAPFGVGYLPSVEIKDEFTHRWVNQLSSLGTLLGGAPGFFKPRVPPPVPSTRGSPDVLNYTMPLL